MQIHTIKKFPKPVTFERFEEKEQVMKRPDPDKPVFQFFPNTGLAVAHGFCPFCEREVKDEEFRDDLSRKEYSISGLCQQCQDEMFGTGGSLK